MPAYDYLVNLGITSANFDIELKRMLGELDKLEQEKKIKLDIQEAITAIGKIQLEIDKLNFPATIFDPAKTALQDLVNLAGNLVTSLSNVSIPTGAGAGASAGAAGVGKVPGGGFGINVGSMKKEAADVSRIVKRSYHEQEGLFKAPGAQPSIDILREWAEGAGGQGGLESLKGKFDELKKKIEELNDLSLVQFRQELGDTTKAVEELRQLKMMYDALVEAHKKLGQAIRDTAKEQQKAITTIVDSDKALNVLRGTMSQAGRSTIQHDDYMRRLKATFGDVVKGATNVSDALSKIKAEFATRMGETETKKIGETISEVSQNMGEFKSTTSEAVDQLKKIEKLSDSIVQSEINLENRKDRVARQNAINVDLTKKRVEDEQRGLKVIEREIDAQTRLAKAVRTRHFIPGKKGEDPREVTRGEYQRYELDRRMLENRRSMFRVDKELLTKVIRFGIIYRGILSLWTGSVDAAKEVVRTMMEMDRIAGQIAKVSPQMFMMNPEGARRLADVMRVAIMYSKQFGSQLESTTESMVLFFQQGLSVSDVLARTKGALELATASGLENQESVEILTAAYEIYGDSIKKPMDFTNALVAVEQLHAVTARDLARGLLATGSTAKEMGLSFHELMGALTAIGVVTRQTGKEVGTALRFIMPRFFMEDAVTQLERIQVELYGFTTEGTIEMRKMGDILYDTAVAWGTMSQAAKLAFATMVAGRRRANTFMALMANFPQYLKASEDALRSEGVAMLSLAAVTDRLDKQMTNLTTLFKEFAFEVGQTGIVDLMTAMFKNAAKKLGVTRDVTESWRGVFDSMFSAYAESASTQLRNLPALFDIHRKELIYSLESTSTEASALGRETYNNLNQTMNQLIDQHKRFQKSTQGSNIEIRSLIQSLSMINEVWKQHGGQLEGMRALYDEITGSQNRYKKGTPKYEEMGEFRKLIQDYLELADAIHKAQEAGTTLTTFKVSGKPLVVADAMELIRTRALRLKELFDAGILKEFDVESRIMAKSLSRTGGSAGAAIGQLVFFRDEVAKTGKSGKILAEGLKKSTDEILRLSESMDEAAPTLDEFSQKIMEAGNRMRKAWEEKNVKGVDEAGRELQKLSETANLDNLKQVAAESFDRVTFGLEETREKIKELGKDSETLKTFQKELQLFGTRMSEYLDLLERTGDYDPKTLDYMKALFSNLTVSSQAFSAGMSEFFDKILIPGWKTGKLETVDMILTLSKTFKSFQSVRGSADSLLTSLQNVEEAKKTLKDTTDEYNKSASIEAKHPVELSTNISEYTQRVMELDRQIENHNVLVSQNIEQQRMESEGVSYLQVRLEVLKDTYANNLKFIEDYYTTSGMMGKEESTRLIEISKKYSGVENQIRKMPPAIQKLAISVMSGLEGVKGAAGIPMEILTLQMDPAKLEEVLVNQTTLVNATDEYATALKGLIKNYRDYWEAVHKSKAEESGRRQVVENSKAEISSIITIIKNYEKSLENLELQTKILSDVESNRMGIIKDLGWSEVDLTKEEYLGKQDLLQLERSRLMENLKEAKILGISDQKVKALLKENVQAMRVNETQGKAAILTATLAKSVDDYSRSVDDLNSYLDKNYSILSSLGYSESQIIDIRIKDTNILKDILMRYSGLNREKLRNIGITLEELRLDKQVAEAMEKYNKILRESEYRLKKREFKLEIKELKFEKLGVSENLAEILDVERSKGELEESQRVLDDILKSNSLQIIRAKGFEESLSKVLEKEKGIVSSVQDITDFLQTTLKLSIADSKEMGKKLIFEKLLSKAKGDTKSETLIIQDVLSQIGISQEDVNKLASKLSYEGALTDLDSINKFYEEILDLVVTLNLTEDQRAKAIEAMDKLKAHAFAVERMNLVLSNRERERAIAIEQDHLEILNRTFDLTKQRIEGESDLYLQLTESEYEIGNTRREQEQQLSLIKYSRSEYTKQYPILDNIYKIQRDILQKHYDENEADIKAQGLTTELTEIRATILDQLREENKTYQDQITSLDSQLLSLQLQEQQIMVNQRASEGWLRTQQAINAAQAVATGMRAAAESAYQGRQEEAQLRRELELERERVALQMARGKMPERTAKGDIASIRRIEVQLDQTRKKNKRENQLAFLEAVTPGIQKMAEDFKVKLVDEDQEAKMRRLFIDNSTMAKDILISGADIAGNKLVQSATMSAQILSGGNAVAGMGAPGGKSIYGPPTPGKANYGIGFTGKEYYANLPPEIRGVPTALSTKFSATTNKTLDAMMGIEKANNGMKNQLMFVGADIAKELAITGFGGSPEVSKWADILSAGGMMVGAPGGPVGMAIGGSIGSIIGAAIGKWREPETMEENTDAIEENTSEVRRNTEQIRELSKQIVSAPTGFVMPQLKGMNVPGYGGGVVININAEGQDARQLALSLGRELGIVSRRGGTVSPGTGGLIIMGGQGNINRRTKSWL